MKRKKFLKTSAIFVASGSAMLAGCNAKETSEGSPGIINKKKYRWRMTTTWPPNFPVFGELAQEMCEWIKIMSGGRLNIKIYGAGELIPGFEAFEAVSNGTIEMGSSTAYYWAGKIPATQFFTGVPFGMNTQQMTSWLIAGDGYKLWQELYKPFNLIPFMGGNTGMQPAGWFKKEIKSINDFKGLKMRISGIGAKAIEKAGGSAVLLPGSEIYTSLERGVIDAAEWVGPFHDYKMGFHKIANYYYTLGWHEPTGQLEYLVNRSKYESLPNDLQEIIKTATFRSQATMQALFDAKNSEYIEKIKNTKGIKVKQFSKDIIGKLKKYAIEGFRELTDSDPRSKKIYDNYQQFKSKVSGWNMLTEKEYYNKL